LRWREAGPHQPITESEPIKYQLAAWFWWRLCQEQGEQVIGDFLAQARQSGAQGNRELVPILERLTGDKGLRNRLRSFNVSELESAIQSYLKELQ